MNRRLNMLVLNKNSYLINFRSILVKSLEVFIQNKLNQCRPNAGLKYCIKLSLSVKSSFLNI